MFVMKYVLVCLADQFDVIRQTCIMLHGGLAYGLICISVGTWPVWAFIPAGGGDRTGGRSRRRNTGSPDN